MYLPKPADEARRLEILRTYEILDTPCEPAFDDLARLATYLFRMPIALITLVDDRREWFKARVGLDLTEATREGLCSFTVLGHDLVVTTDAAADPRFSENPYVIGPPKVRFYAGAPLFTPEGPVIGTLSVIDVVPREFSRQDGQALTQLARQVQTQLELRRALTQARRAAAVIREAAARSMRHEATLVALSRSLFEAGSLEEALRRIVQQTAEALGIARVNAWRYVGDHGAIRCVAHYQSTSRTFSSGMELKADDFPRYFEALRKNNLIVADDAVRDSRTREFTESYLGPLGITSMLDAPVFVGNTLEGVLCHEHVGSPRTWSEDEKVFAVGAANLVSLAIEQWERRRAEEELSRSEEKRFLAEETAKNRNSFERLVGRSAPMQEVYRKLRLAAQSDVTVLLTGESGTGKELAAAAIHSLSERKSGPFVAVNCSAIPEALLESELFGHVKGAFTGAIRDKAGLFQAADGGTLFLDEVAEMAPPLQVKVLRALQEREIRRVGDERVSKINVRIIAATNRDLGRLVEEEKLREDFYYRIRVFDIPMPPLRDRRDDIPLLVDHFVAGKVASVAPAAMRALMCYEWPGNVRELQNAVEHALVTRTGSVLTLSHLPSHVRQGMADTTPTEDLRRRVLDALTQCGGNREKAAKVLRVSRVTLWKWMNKLGIVNDKT
jgi:transcriptional regulator with GAF, ATPase, and Fis domain